MTTSGLSTEVRRLDERTAVIDIKGEVTSAAGPALTEAFESAGTPGTQVVALNFTDLDYMNSGGIGMLVTLLVRVRRQKQKLAAFGLTDHYAQIFELTRLDEAIAIHPDEQSLRTAVTR